MKDIDVAELRMNTVMLAKLATLLKILSLRAPLSPGDRMAH